MVTLPIILCSISMAAWESKSLHKLHCYLGQTTVSKHVVDLVPQVAVPSSDLALYVCTQIHTVIYITSMSMSVSRLGTFIHRHEQRQTEVPECLEASAVGFESARTHYKTKNPSSVVQHFEIKPNKCVILLSKIQGSSKILYLYCIAQKRDVSRH